MLPSSSSVMVYSIMNEEHLIYARNSKDSIFAHKESLIYCIISFRLLLHSIYVLSKHIKVRVFFIKISSFIMMS